MGGVERSSERELQKNDGAQSGRLPSGNGAGSGTYRNRLEHGAALSLLTLCSHALVHTMDSLVRFGQM